MKNSMEKWTDEYTLERITYDLEGEVESRVYHTFKADELNELLDYMSYFLQGCSYTYVTGLKAIKE